MLHVRKLLIVGATLLVAACSHTVEANPNISDVIVPRPAPVTLQRPQTMTVNQTNIEQFNALVRSGQVFITMPLEEFNRLIENNQEVIVYMANQNAVIDTYESRIK